MPVSQSLSGALSAQNSSQNSSQTPSQHLSQHPSQHAAHVSVSSPNAAGAIRFHQLHQQGLLLLANVWDGGSARLVAQAGAVALATTSAGVAWSHGYADGNHLPRELLLTSVRNIARVSDLPLSVDIVAGYSDNPDEVATLVAALMDIGVVGINIEDGNNGVDLLCRKIAAVRRQAEQQGVKLFINARTDVYLRALVDAEQRNAEVLARAARYQDAGASGLFVPGVTAAADIGAIAAGTSLPLNILLRATTPPPAELAALGVRRLSAGSSLPEAAYGRARDWAKRFLDAGDNQDLLAAAMPYAQLNAAMG